VLSVASPADWPGALLCDYLVVLTPEPDMQQRLVNGLERHEKYPPDHEPLLDPFQYVTSANYVVPMLLHLAIKEGNEIVDRVPQYSSLDHAANWQTLVAAIARFEKFLAPYFDHAILSDPFAEELLSYERRKHERRHAIASFRQGLWELFSDGNGLRVVLAKPARRSALYLVSNLAARVQYPLEAIEQLDRRPEEMDLRELALSQGTSGLDVFSQSAPKSWESLCAGIGFPMDMVPHFRAWIIDLWKPHYRRWFSTDETWADWAAFADERGFDRRTVEQFDALVGYTPSPRTKRCLGAMPLS
jgi:hypothetical protein